MKPSSAGSSVGAHKVKKAEDLRPAIEDAFLYDDKVLVEEMIAGREIEVALLGNEEPQASCVGEILSADEFYDYDAKYNNPESRTRVIDDLPEETLNQVRNYAVEIFKALDCRGCPAAISSTATTEESCSTRSTPSGVHQYQHVSAALGSHGQTGTAAAGGIDSAGFGRTSVELIKKEHANPQLSDAALRAFT